MRSYDIRFPIIVVSLTMIFSGLGNFTYGQENETSQTYENKDLGIRFLYLSYWGNIVQLGEENCHNQHHCAVGILSNPFRGNIVVNKSSKENCLCGTLMEFVKWVYKADKQSEGFSFINDNQTTIGKNQSGWQYQYSLVKDGVNSTGHSFFATNDDMYYSIFVIYPDELKVKRLPEIRKLIDSIEFLPIQNQVAKTPSFMNMNETQEPKSSTTIHNNTIFEEHLPPITVGDRQASLYTKVSPPVLKSDKKQNGLFQLSLIDSKTGNNITNVNYFLTISKGNKEVLRELFYSKDGPLTLKFEPNQGPVTFHGTTEPFLGGWMNETGPVTVSGPVLTEGGQYHYTVEIFGIDNVRNIFKPSNAPRFDSSFNMNTNEAEQTKPSLPSLPLESNPNGLQILSHNSFTDSIGYLHVVGEVQNNTPSDAKFVQVTGTFYDSNNQVVGTEFTFTNPSDIGSGQKAPFDLTLSSASIPVSQIDRYNLIASSQ